MSEQKEVTRAELEGMLWDKLNRMSFSEKWIDTPPLLHESISAREVAAMKTKPSHYETEGLQTV